MSYLLTSAGTLFTRRLVLLTALVALLVQTEGYAQCDQTIVPDTLIADFTGSPVGFCLDYDYSSALRSDRFLDGVRQTAPAEGCDFDTLTYYPYFTFPYAGQNGPYELVSWEVGGQTFSGTFQDVDELVRLLNGFDPAGIWINDGLTLNIVGGFDGDYGPLTVRHIADNTTRTVLPNNQRVAAGTFVSVTGGGFHEYTIFDPVTGCRDTVIFGLRTILSDVRMQVQTDFNTTTDPFCLDNTGFPGTPQAFSFCGSFTDGTLNVQGATCFTYTPDLDFTGSDEVCFTVCDDTAPPLGPVCRQTTVEVIVRAPNPIVTDTIRVRMMQNDTTFCINSVLDIDGPYDRAELCQTPGPSFGASLTAFGCVSLQPDRTYVGVDTFCFLYCAAGVCDTTIVIAEAVAPCAFGLFDVALDSIPSLGDPTPYCLPLTQEQLAEYTIQINGAAFTGTLGECDFQRQFFYNYAPLYADNATGPFEVRFWNANGSTYTGAVADSTALEAFMRQNDPTGNWRLTGPGLNIVGGDPGGTYGTMQVQNVNFGTTNELFANPVPVAQGATLPLPGDGRYDITLIQNIDGCRDDITVVVGEVPEFENRELLVPVVMDSFSESTCLFNTLRADVRVCDPVANGATVIDALGCVVYTPNAAFIGNDTLCTVNCDVPVGTACDTTVVVFEVRPLPDTVYVTNFGDAPFTACGNLAFGGPYNLPSFCGTTGPFQAVPSTAAGCLDIDPDDGVAGNGEICVEFCSLNDPTVCQQVIFIIDHTPNCTPSIFGADTVRVDSSAGTLIYCLADGADLSDFSVAVNGQPAFSVPDPSCGTRTGTGTRNAFAYSTLILPDGPYRIDGWDANGTLVLNVSAANFSDLADSMSVYDQVLDWTYDPAIPAIVASGAMGNYTQLILFDVANNGGAPPIALTTIQVTDPNGGALVPGTAIALPRPGLYDVMVTANDSSCGERVVLFRPLSQPPQVDTFRFDGVADSLNGPFCLPVTDLGNQPTSIVSCGAPAVGTMTFPNLQCLNYAAPAGFSGSDTACVLICTDNGLTCDTSIVIFNITDPSLCEDIFDRDSYSTIVDDCNGQTTVCLPGFVEEFFFYTLSVDGGAAAPAMACGADTVTIYSYGDVAGNGQAGPYRIEDYTINGVNYTTPLPGIDDLVDSLNRWDPSGAWMQDPATSTIRGGVSGTTYLPLTLRQIATDTINRLDPFIQLFENQASVMVDTGDHVIVVRDTRTGCTDTLELSVLCDTNADCLDITPVAGVSFDLDDCTGTAAFAVETVTLDAGLLEFRVDGQVVASVVTGNEASIFLPVGQYIVTVLDPVAACIETFDVIVQCDPCANAALPGSIGQGINCLATDVEVCLPLPAAALRGFRVLLNGVPYTGGFVDCDLTERLLFDVSGIGAGGLRVDSFFIEGQRFATDVSDLAALADTLSQWDDFATWNFDATSATLTGGDVVRTYSDLFLTELGTQTTSVLLLERDVVVGGAAVSIPGGGALAQTLSFDDGAGCQQDVALTFACVTTTTAADTIEVGQDTLFCVNTDELTGPVVSLTNACPNPDAPITFDFDTTPGCVIATGVAPGSSTACLVACDAAGVCDTTFYTVFATDADGDVIAVDDDNTVRRGNPLVMSVTANDTFGILTRTRIVTPPTGGTASIDAAGILTYTPTGETCGFTDSLTYEICTGTQCDEATVRIRVRCEVVEVYTGFSPNGDGVNETFRIEGIEDFPNNTLHVYNRWGNEVFQADGYNNEWDGMWDGNRLIDGTYFYVLQLNDPDAGEEEFVGWVQLFR